MCLSNSNERKRNEVKKCTPTHFLNTGLVDVGDEVARKVRPCD